MDSGVKVVGATSSGEEPAAPDPVRDAASPPAGFFPADPPHRTRFIATTVVAVLGLVGTVTFGLLWSGGGSATQDPAVKSAATLFLHDFFNVDAKSVDANFSAITRMATGKFAGQAQQFFNSAIRQQLEKALAVSRGQIRALYVQNDNGQDASVYAVVDQQYANNKVTTPQSDVVRILVYLHKVGSTWKISNVTTLEGATPASVGTPSGSAGSTVPGQ